MSTVEGAVPIKRPKMRKACGDVTHDEESDQVDKQYGSTKHLGADGASPQDGHPEPRENQDQLYFRSYSDFGIHQEMLADRVRTSAYRLAILRNYEKIRGKVVLDVGAGTGILSMFCVHAGAKRVYAVEASDMAAQAEIVICSNRMEDKITVIHGRLEDVEIPESVDVIVSEWMGYFLLYESMLLSVLYARDKWLKPDGVMLPGRAKLCLAPFTDDQQTSDAVDETFWDDVRDWYKVDVSALKPYARKCRTSRVHVQLVEPLSVMAHATTVCDLDLQTMSAESLKHIQAEFDFSCFGRAAIDGFVVWFTVEFPKGVTLSTAPEKPATHWQQCVLYLENPVEVELDTKISGSICLSPHSQYTRFLNIQLTVSVGENGSNVQQNYLMDDFLS